MRRKLYAVALLSAAALAVIVVVVSQAIPGRRLAPLGLPEPGQPASEVLPISQVVLFNSGVGYFQREGQIEGDGQIEMQFATGDINDLLKSLILEDQSGGKVNVVSYDSSDPIDKILRSFALDLTTNPTFGDLLNQARGEKVEALLEASNNSPETKITGTIVGMEVRTSTKNDKTSQVEMLNLNTATGMKSIQVSKVIQVQFLNPILQNEMKQALNVLASSHDVRKKRVSLGFKGAGKRKIRVGYVVERPIWKMTYRLRLEEDGKLYLQGWALVENTSDNDWKNVQLSLVSGRPISFKMNLYDPLYIPRPTVEPDLFASLRPPVYDPNLGAVPGGLPGAGAGNPANQMPQVGQGFQFGGGGFQIGGGFGGQFGGQIGGQFQGGFQGGFQGRTQFAPVFVAPNMQWAVPNRYQQQQLLKLQEQQNAIQNLNRLTYDQLRQRREQQGKAKGDAKKVGAKIVGMNFKKGIESVATAEEIGDYFRFSLDQKVTLARQRSAMLPVFNSTLIGDKVSIYNRATHKRHPLLGLRFKNSSGHPLTQGPVTVYDRHSYAGDTRILDVQPGEKRLLSYAMDLGTKVYVNYKITPSPEVTFKLGTDSLQARYFNRKTTTYRIHNRSPHAKTMIVEHPITGDWKLIEPEKTAGKTNEVYRFEVKTPPDKTTEFKVVEKQKRDDPITVAKFTGGRAPLYASAPGMTVYINSTTTPSPQMTFKIGSDKLTARYDNLRRTSFLFENLMEEPRTLTLEYPIVKDWELISPKKPAETTKEFKRFVVTLKKGETGRFDMVEEQPRADLVALVSSKQGPLYPVAAGIEVKPVVKTKPKQLFGVEAVKGRLHVRHKTTESKVYYVQNESGEDRTFQIDHVIRPDWTLIDPKGKPQKGPDIQRYVLEVSAKKTGLQKIVEEMITLDDKKTVKETPVEALAKYRDSTAVSGPVRKALAKVLEMEAMRKQTQQKISKAEKELTRLGKDQSRLRDNLRIIPMNSEPYKQFLNKFVKQEVQFEELQDEVRRETAVLEKQSREYERFVTTLTVK